MHLRDDDLWLAGGVMLLAMLAQRTVQWGTGWLWPIPDLIDPQSSKRYPAVISQEFRGAGSSEPHYGVDLMYRQRPGFTAPPGVPVAAARDGTLWSVTRTARGWAVVVDHGKPWATFYQHLETIAPEVASGAQGAARAAPALPLRAGQQLGVMGSDPTDGGHVRHLHFATWYQGAGDPASVDPAVAMSGWGRWSWPWIRSIT